MAYRGVLIITGRDYVYLKKVKQMSKSRNVISVCFNSDQIWFEVSRSIEHESYPPVKKKTRGFINLQGSMIQPLMLLPPTQ